MEPINPLEDFIEALQRWRDDVFDYGQPMRFGSAGEPAKSAKAGIESLNRRAASLTVWLHLRDRGDIAGAVDDALKDVRGWSWAYDEGLCDQQDLGGYHYREIDYVVEAADIAISQLQPIREQLDASVWQGFADA
jgi:hypothetical protein